MWGLEELACAKAQGLKVTFVLENDSSQSRGMKAQMTEGRGAAREENGDQMQRRIPGADYGPRNTSPCLCFSSGHMGSCDRTAGAQEVNSIKDSGPQDSEAGECSSLSTLSWLSPSALLDSGSVNHQNISRICPFSTSPMIPLVQDTCIFLGSTKSHPARLGCS